MFNMYLVMVALVPCKSYCYLLLIQNGDVYTDAELSCKQIAKSEEDLLDPFLITYFETVISCAANQLYDLY